MESPATFVLPTAWLTVSILMVKVEILHTSENFRVSQQMTQGEISKLATNHMFDRPPPGVLRCDRSRNK